MLVFPCHVCRTDLSALESQAGQLVRCPSCLTTLRVPSAAADPAAALASMTAGSAGSAGGAYGGGFAPPKPFGNLGSFIPGRPTGKRYGFNCGYCSSRL